MAQLVRAPPCHGGGRRFEPDPGRFILISRLCYNLAVCGILAQLGEHLPYKQGVTGSSPVGPIIYIRIKFDFMDGFPSGQRGQTVNLLAQPSKVRILPHPLLSTLSARSASAARLVGNLAKGADMHRT